MSYLQSVAEAIGKTPMISLSRITKALRGNILAKLEYFNPGLSKKDRIARQMIRDAKDQGLLKPAQPVVELTSGNTGTGLAIVCASEGHQFYAVMSRGNSIERARMMRALGAEVVLVDQAEGSIPGQVSGADLALVEIRAKSLTMEVGGYRADQFQHTGNFRAHFLHTAPEMWAQAGHIDAFVDFVGSGGTFAGCSAYLRLQNPECACYVVEPQSAPALANPLHNSSPTHSIQGGGYNFTIPQLPLLHQVPVDGFISISDSEAIQTARDLARKEGVFGGFSGGANVAAALRVLREAQHRPDFTVACLICDSGLKYLSTDLYE